MSGPVPGAEPAQSPPTATAAVGAGNEAVPLAAPGSGLGASGAYAVLIGTGRHVAGSRLPDLPGVTTTLDDLAAALRDSCGITHPDRIHRVPDDADADAVIAAVERAVAKATGPVLLYYVGHGLLGPRDALYLATHATTDEDRIAGAVPYRTVRDLLGDAVGGSIVVLDCCFSGRAGLPSADSAAQAWKHFASARPDGSLLLTSASGYDLSFAPPGSRHTLFSGHVLDLLTTGDPAGPLWHTTDSLYAALERRFRDGPVRPRRQGEGTLGSLPVARNRAYRTASGTAPVLPPADVPCPYPGMEALRAAESRHFFGREALTERLIDMVCASVPATPVVLVGASGVGKSSILRAGLLAGLERSRTAPGGSAADPGTGPLPRLWPALLLSAPGPRPVRALAELWARATGRDADAVHAAIAAPGGVLPPPLPGRESCGLLVVDQFEEVFTRCEDPGERERFLELLADGPRTVLGLRADLYGSCLAHPVLVRALKDSQLTVPPMAGDELRAVIERPARAVGLSLETGLTDRLLRDLRTGPDAASALPFLAHALRETWLARSGATLTLAGYEGTGGIWHSVTTTTETLYRLLSSGEQELLRELLMRLVHLTPADADGDAVVRRRVARDGLLYGLTPQQRESAAALRDRLTAARLITVDRDGVQIAHEALLRSWPRLRSWIEEDREGLVVRQRLTESAEAWAAADRHPDFHLRGSRLGEAYALIREERLRHRRLPRLDEEFLTAGRRAELAERQRETRRTRRLQAALAGVVVGLCLALVAAGLAFQQRASADGQRRRAIHQALVERVTGLRDEQPLIALKLALAAERIDPTSASRAAVVDTLVRTDALTSSIDTGTKHDYAVLDPTGTLEAAVDARGGVSLWRIDERATRTRLGVRLTAGCELDAYAALVFSRDGRMLAGTCPQGTVVVWRIASLPADGTWAPAATLRIPGLTEPAQGVALNSDGTLLAASGQGERGHKGAIALWNIENPSSPRQLGTVGDVYDSSAVVFSPDGKTLLSHTDLTTGTEEPKDRHSLTTLPGTTLWDIGDPAAPRALTRLPNTGTCRAFSPDGRRLVTTNGNEVRVWDVRDPAKPAEIARWPAHRGAVSAVRFSEDGSRLLTAGSADKDLALYAMTALPKVEVRARFSGHTDGVVDAAFTSQHSAVVSVGRDGRVIRWDLENWGRPVVAAEVVGGGASITSAAFTTDGRMLATGGYSQDVTLWNTAEPRRPEKLAVVPGDRFVWGVAFSRDGRTLAIGYVRAGVRLYDLRDPSRPKEAPDSAEGRALATALTFATENAIAPDGGLLAMGGPLEVVLRRRADSGKGVALPEGKGTPGFSPDGRTLATLDYDADLILWDVRDPEEPARLARVPETEDDIAGLAYHPAGALVAGLQSSGEVNLWDVGDPTRPHQAALLTGHSDGVNAIAFHPDKRYAVTAGSDGRAILWDLGRLPRIVADPTGMACTTAGGGFTPEEWKKYVPDLPFRKTCA
ncbi:caspase family protein [Streptomyces sp. NPDC089799]|uniref:caspase, EACC1-associated type n=1 Tax=Streptomyces sp. NPDC089799 TaxID=3155066 RepID=UPI00342A3056